MAQHNRSNDEPPIGMLPDGTLNVVQPGVPAATLKIVGPDGTEYLPEDFDENGNLIERKRMVDTIEVDLVTLKRVLDDGLGFRPNRLDGCLPQIGISTENLAALLARNLG